MLKIALLDCATNEKCSLFQATFEQKKKTRGWHRGEGVPSSLSLSLHYPNVTGYEKCFSVDGGRGICPLFSSPPRGIWQLKSPHPQEFAIQGKKNANTRGSAREELGAAGIDWCINITSWFAVALAEIRTRRILREKVDCKQSKQACSYGFFLLGIHICQAWEQQQVLQHFGAKLADLTGGYCSI